MHDVRIKYLNIAILLEIYLYKLMTTHKKIHVMSLFILLAKVEKC